MSEGLRGVETPLPQLEQKRGIGRERRIKASIPREGWYEYSEKKRRETHQQGKFVIFPDFGAIKDPKEPDFVSNPKEDWRRKRTKWEYIVDEDNRVTEVGIYVSGTEVKEFWREEIGDNARIEKDPKSGNPVLVFTEYPPSPTTSALPVGEGEK